MKSTASNPNAATEAQKKSSRQDTSPGAAGSRQRPTTAAASASEKATARTRRGEALSAEGKGDRSPKQENL
jgi:hypothetical protein